jgi:hypothetical protein
MLGSVKCELACVAFLSACRDGVDASPEEAVPLEENTAASSPEQSDSLKASNQMPGSEDPSEDGPSLVAVAERAEGKAVFVDEHVEETAFEPVDEARPPRDLSAELNAAVGNPIDCTRDAPSGRPFQAPKSRPIQEPTSRPIQEPSSRRIRGPEPRPIDGWDVDESSKDWR